MSNNIFHCKYRNCHHYLSSFNRLLNHAWDRHKNCLNFNCVYGISSCTSTYTNPQSHQRYLKLKLKWFYEKHVKASEFNERNNFESNGNEEVQGVFSDETNDMNLSGSKSSFGNNDGSPVLDIIGKNEIDEIGENNIEFNKLIGERLLDLRENF